MKLAIGFPDWFCSAIKKRKAFGLPLFWFLEPFDISEEEDCAALAFDERVHEGMIDRDLDGRFGIGTHHGLGAHDDSCGGSRFGTFFVHVNERFLDDIRDK